jgi:ubiquinone/menaquinone biosynthesis C-methylase UbiE
MDARLQRRVQRYGWDKASGCYEEFWQEQLRPARDRLLEMAALRPGESALDIACGTGLVSFEALEILGRDGYLLGTDISERMVEKATAIAAELDVHNVRFQWMDAEDLQADDSNFDVAICSLGLMYIPDPRKALEEMRRVLRPGGRAVCSVWGPRESCGWAELFEIVDRNVASEVCPMFFQLGRPEMLELTFKAAGFAGVAVSRIATQLLYRDDREALGAAFEGGPVALAYHKFSDAVKDTVHADYLASIAQYRRDDGYAIPGEFVVARGER